MPQEPFPVGGHERWVIFRNDPDRADFVSRWAASGALRLEARDLDALRDARRRSITGISDEVLGEYFGISTIMLGVINRLDLYRDLRQP